VLLIHLETNEKRFVFLHFNSLELITEIGASHTYVYTFEIFDEFGERDGEVAIVSS